MDRDLQQLLKQCVENAGEQDLHVIASMLEGVKDKLAKKKSTYIDGILHMDRSVEDELCKIDIPVTPFLSNTLGIVHGGVTATVIDTAMGTLANYILPEEYGAVTTQLNVHYIAPGLGESLRCEARFIHRGTKTMVLGADMYRADGTKIAYATGSFFVVKKDMK
ncbi:PaaI family thioesterase [Bacillus sp. T33-2]|uniref:PaaI family thioesterase n=1 Tax=Bacillus sp. T33-2 TaxID=2054168 RepID=UPI000C7714A0|nr:PaaI family thioesterase [Bacillus sp. T33-2]PLR97408.1 PaaI family thioesterase [Bacillus sp. T33-2]